MPVRPIQPSRTSDMNVMTQQMLPTAAASFKKGAPLQRNATNDNKVEVHAGGATVTGIVGIAGAEVVSGLPAAHGDIAYGVTIPVYKASAAVDFLAQVTNAATPVTVAGDGSYEGNTYGLVANSNYWTVDVGDTTDVVLRVVKELPEINCVLFRFLPSAVVD